MLKSLRLSLVVAVAIVVGVSAVTPAPVAAAPLTGCTITAYTPYQTAPAAVNYGGKATCPNSNYSRTLRVYLEETTRSSSITGFRTTYTVDTFASCTYSGFVIAYRSHAQLTSPGVGIALNAYSSWQYLNRDC